MSIPIVKGPDMAASLRGLCAALEQAQFPLPGSYAEFGRDICADLIRQLEDYILPRYDSLDAPLLAVVGGPTGAGKSLLVNSLVREHVASSTAIRPTTRSPLLVHAPGEGSWFASQRVLPGLARVRGIGAVENKAGVQGELRLAEHEGVPRGARPAGFSGYRFRC